MFRDSGSAWQLDDTTLLYTAKGQLLASSASAVVGALAAGTDGYVLMADSAQTLGIKWAAGSSGAVTLISDQTVSGSVAANILFSSISSSYNHLQVLVQARGDTAANNVTLRMQLNSDTTSGHYQWEYLECYAGNTANGTESASDTAFTLGKITANTSPASDPGQCALWIPNYTGTTWHKTYTSDYGLRVNTGTSATLKGQGVGVFVTTPAALTDIKLFPSAGNFAIGSRFTLYGYT